MPKLSKKIFYIFLLNIIFVVIIVADRPWEIPRDDFSKDEIHEFWTAYRPQFAGNASTPYIARRHGKAISLYDYNGLKFKIPVKENVQWAEFSCSIYFNSDIEGAFNLFCVMEDGNLINFRIPVEQSDAMTLQVLDQQSGAWKELLREKVILTNWIVYNINLKVGKNEIDAGIEGKLHFRLKTDIPEFHAGQVLTENWGFFPENGVDVSNPVMTIGGMNEKRCEENTIKQEFFKK